MTMYCSLIVNVFHADLTPLELQREVKRLIETIKAEPDWIAPYADVDVEIDEHTGGCEQAVCGCVNGAKCGDL